jgi:hypothetical protein
MTLIQRLMRRHRLMDQAGSQGTDTGGTGTGAGGDGSGAGAGAGGGEGGAPAGQESGAPGAGAGEGGGEGGEPGATKPSDAEAKLIKEVMTKKTALEAANEKLKEVNAKLKDYEGIDVAKVRQMLAEAEAAELQKAEAKGDYERLKKQMADSHKADKATLEQQIEVANQKATAYAQQIAELTVGGAFGSSTFIPELTLPTSKARALYGSHFEFKDGIVVGYDKPASVADRAPLVDAAGIPLSFDAALKKIVDADPDRESLYRSKLKPGAGSGTQKAKSKDLETTSGLTGTDRIAQGLKKLANQSGGK